MTRSFVDAAGPRPARGTPGLWRQAALLAVAVAVDGGAESRIALARALLALDHPGDAAATIGALDTPDARWLQLLAQGQSGDLDGLRQGTRALRGELPDTPESRELSRRLFDLDSELDALSGIENGARFDLIAHALDPRRVLVQGRSSATLLADPGGRGPLRLGPYRGFSAGNRAVFGLAEVIDRIGVGARVAVDGLPPDDAPTLQPGVMLEALAEAGRERTEELSRLAEEVRDEREELAKRADELDDEMARLIAERARLKRVPTPGATVQTGESAYLPRTESEAAALLGVGPTSSRAEVDQAYRDLIRGAHPDRVANLHPGLRQEAESLTVALNAARDLLLAQR